MAVRPSSSGANRSALARAAKGASFWRRIQANQGMATAEFAILLPAAVFLLIFGVGLTGLQLQQLGLTRQVGFLARAIEAGAGHSTVAQMAAKAGIKVTIIRSEIFDCVTGTKPANLAGMRIAQNARACALVPGE